MSTSSAWSIVPAALVFLVALPLARAAPPGPCPGARYLLDALGVAHARLDARDLPGAEAALLELRSCLRADSHRSHRADGSRIGRVLRAIRTGSHLAADEMVHALIRSWCRLDATRPPRRMAAQ